MKLGSAIIGIILSLGVLISASCVFAATDVTFAWDSNTESDMSHYNIYMSSDGQTSWSKVNASPITHAGTGTETWTQSAVPDGEYAWYATAVDTSDNESDPSNIVTKRIDTTAPAPPANFFIELVKKILAWLFGLGGSLRFG